MKRFWPRIPWGIGATMPVFIGIADELASRQLLGMTEFSGVWIYQSVLAGMAFCLVAVIFMRLGNLKRLGLQLLAAAIIVLEVFGMGAFYLYRDGLLGVQ